MIVKAKVIPWPKTGSTHYHAQLGLPEEVRTINKLVVWLGVI